MSNLLSNASMYGIVGEFTFVAPPSQLNIHLSIKEPTHLVQFKDQSFSYVQGTLPLFADIAELSVPIKLNSISISNAIRSSSHSVVVI